MPLIGIAEETKPAQAAPKDIVISTYRVTVKDGHMAAFKAAIAAHAQKYHKGDWSWRVGEVISGPSGGDYQIIEGPFTWTTFDGRSDLGAEHQKDYDTNILPHTEKATPDTYATFEEDLSTTAATKWSNKVIIYHYTAKPGKGWLLGDALKFMKEINAKRQLATVVWRSAFSGETAFSLAYRTKDGWKDLDMDLASMKKVADELRGENAYARLQADIAESCKSISSEMVEYRSELGSK
ncbi:MAG: hypothetical protein JWM32_3225 [Verrucomicrobia bacterium]|nr:hypothetical protein [Verrucomicrobiota bacterium]